MAQAGYGGGPYGQRGYPQQQPYPPPGGYLPQQGYPHQYGQPGPQYPQQYGQPGYPGHQGQYAMHSGQQPPIAYGQQIQPNGVNYPAMIPQIVRVPDPATGQLVQKVQYIPVSSVVQGQPYSPTQPYPYQPDPRYGGAQMPSFPPPPPTGMMPEKERMRALKEYTRNLKEYERSERKVMREWEKQQTKYQRERELRREEEREGGGRGGVLGRAGTTRARRPSYVDPNDLTSAMGRLNMDPRAEYGRGEYGRGEYGRGEPGREEYGRGDYGRHGRIGESDVLRRERERERENREIEREELERERERPRSRMERPLSRAGLERPRSRLDDPLGGPGMGIGMERPRSRLAEREGLGGGLEMPRPGYPSAGGPGVPISSLPMPPMPVVPRAGPGDPPYTTNRSIDHDPNAPLYGGGTRSRHGSFGSQGGHGRRESETSALYAGAGGYGPAGGRYGPAGGAGGYAAQAGGYGQGGGGYGGYPQQPPYGGGYGQPGYGGAPPYGGQGGYGQQYQFNNNMPQSFLRAPDPNLSYEPFPNIVIAEDLDEILGGLPPRPGILRSHDISREDWQRLVSDLTYAWSGEMGRMIRRPRRSSLLIEIIETWNMEFFLKRGVEAVLYKGRERRTGDLARGDLSGDESEYNDTDSEDDDEEDESDGSFGRGTLMRGRYTYNPGDAWRMEGDAHRAREAYRERRNRRRLRRTSGRERADRGRMEEGRPWKLVLKYVPPRNANLIPRSPRTGGNMLPRSPRVGGNLLPRSPRVGGRPII